MLENFGQLRSCMQTDSITIYSILNPVNQPYLQVPAELTYLHYSLCALTVAITAAATLDKHPFAGCRLAELIKKKDLCSYCWCSLVRTNRHTVTAAGMAQSDWPTFLTKNLVTFLYKHTASLSVLSKLYPCCLPSQTPSHFTLNIHHPVPSSLPLFLFPFLFCHLGYTFIICFAQFQHYIQMFSLPAS